MPHVTAADILTLRPRVGTPPKQGELPASVEFRGPHGMINYFLWGATAPALCAREEVAGLTGGLQSWKLLQSEEDPAVWSVALRGADMDTPPVEYPIEAAEVDAVLKANGIALPDLTAAAKEPPQENGEAGDDPNAPPF